MLVVSSCVILWNFHTIINLVTFLTSYREVTKFIEPYQKCHFVSTWASAIIRTETLPDRKFSLKFNFSSGVHPIPTELYVQYVHLICCIRVKSFRLLKCGQLSFDLQKLRKGLQILKPTFISGWRGRTTIPCLSYQI